MSNDTVVRARIDSDTRRTDLRGSLALLAGVVLWAS